MIATSNSLGWYCLILSTSGFVQVPPCRVLGHQVHAIISLPNESFIIMSIPYPLFSLHVVNA